MSKKPLGITLPISLGANGYFSNTTDPNEQIRSNMTNLLLTRKGERPFQPDFGCDVYKSVFESNTDQSLAGAVAEIETSVATWMPFVRIDDVSVVTRSEDGHEITIQIKYTVLTTNNSDSIVLVF